MPTVLRARRLRIVIYATDHVPAHVHVVGAQGEAKVRLVKPGEKPSVMTNHHLRTNELADALDVIESSLALLQRKWKELHGNR